MDVVVIGRPIDLEGHYEQHPGDEHHDRRRHPEGRPQGLPAPAGQLSPGLVAAGLEAEVGHGRGLPIADQASRHTLV
jgi:hypothetical protein